MYSAKVMDHFANPRNVGEIENADGVGEVGNPKCGDIMKMFLKIDNNVITDVKFKTFGCGAAIATSSIATEMIKGKTIDEALKLTNKAVVEALDGLPPVKLHCSVLAEQAVSDHLRAHRLLLPASGGSGGQHPLQQPAAPPAGHPGRAAHRCGAVLCGVPAQRTLHLRPSPARTHPVLAVGNPGG